MRSNCSWLLTVPSLCVPAPPSAQAAGQRSIHQDEHHIQQSARAWSTCNKWFACHTYRNSHLHAILHVCSQLSWQHHVWYESVLKSQMHSCLFNNIRKHASYTRAASNVRHMKVVSKHILINVTAWKYESLTHHITTNINLAMQPPLAKLVVLVQVWFQGSQAHTWWMMILTLWNLPVCIWASLHAIIWLNVAAM